MTWYRRVVFVSSGLFVGIGVALLVRTASIGGGVTGYVLGALFVALGTARIILERKRGSS
jgi:hypothetical protein